MKKYITLLYDEYDRLKKIEESGHTDAEKTTEPSQALSKPGEEEEGEGTIGRPPQQPQPPQQPPTPAERSIEDQTSLQPPALPRSPPPPLPPPPGEPEKKKRKVHLEREPLVREEENVEQDQAKQVLKPVQKSPPIRHNPRPLRQTRTDWKTIWKKGWKKGGGGGGSK